jgi:hypothetical protein
MLVALEISLLLMPAALTLLDYHYLCHKVEWQKKFKTDTFSTKFCAYSSEAPYGTPL